MCCVHLVRYLKRDVHVLHVCGVQESVYNVVFAMKTIKICAQKNISCFFDVNSRRYCFLVCGCSLAVVMN